MQRFKSESLNSAIEESYVKFENYKIKIFDESKDTVYIYFSSNGLYFPDEINVFRHTIFERNYFEWENLSNHSVVASNTNKAIFVRDVWKSWYVNGINAQLNTQDKLADFLKTICERKKIVTVGVSAGATAAILFGCLLKADRIVAFSPQIDLHLSNEQGAISCFDEIAGDEILSKYLDLRPLIETYTGNLICVFPNGNFKDNSQYSLISDNPNIKFFVCKSKSHGVVLYPESIAILIGGSDDDIISLYEYFKIHKCSPSRVLMKTNGRIFTYKYISKSFVKKVVRKIKKYL